MSNQIMDPKVKIASILTILVAFSLFIIKFYAYRLTGSQAIFSEAMESIVNVIASLVTFLVVYYAAKPADKDHPYGHGKVEYLSAALEGGMIAFAAFLILVEAVQAFYEKRPLNSLDMGLWLLAGTGVVNVLMGFYLKTIGKRKNSVALEASGAHLMADFWTTVGVLAGLGLVMLTHIIWLDRLIAIFVSLHLMKEAYQLVRKSLGGLLDEEEETLVSHIRDLVNGNPQPGIIQVHHVRVMRSGSYHHIDAHVVVPEFWSVEQAHDDTLAYERKLFQQYKYSGEIHFHVDPCRKLYCQFCDLENCPVRTEEFQERREVSIKELTDKDEPRDVTIKLRNR